jgi:hypothetical protein
MINMQNQTFAFQPPVSQVSRSERRWVLWFAIVVMAVTALPYLLGYAVQGTNWRFSGFVFGVEDGNSYIAKMLSGAYGAWLFRTPYTALPQNGALAFLPYLLLGKLAAPPGEHEQLVALFQIFRFIAGLLAILATYDFLALFIVPVRVRRWGLALVTIGGGLGWLLVLLGNGQMLGSMPLDFYSPETFGFLSLFGLPHLALARALLLWGFVIYLWPGFFSSLAFLVCKIWRIDLAGVSIGVLWLLLGLAQPLTVVIGWAVLFAHLCALGAYNFWKRWAWSSSHWDGWRSYLWRSFWAVLVSSPLVIYTMGAFYLDPFLRSWTAQNLILSPHPLHYLLAYGLLVPFAIWGADRLLKTNPVLGWFLAAWVLLLPLLAYAPLNLQRRLPEGIWVAWIVLALSAFQIRQAGKQTNRSFRYFQLFSLLLFPSTLLLLSGGLMAAGRPGQPVFYPSNEVTLFETLGSRARPGEVVLTSFKTGNILPAWAPLRVVIGHGPESANLASLQPQVEAFYQAQTSDGERLELLQTYHVRYVFWGPDERSLGAWNPQDAAYLSLVSQSGEYAVYEVLANTG